METNYGLLADEAFAWIARRASLVPCLPAVSYADKFIVRSAMQKAIRRGDSDRAVSLVLRLHRVDPSYSKRALLTVAIEDVGFGAPDAVLWATAARSEGFRRAVGEVPLLIALTMELCGACKTRSACELAFVTDATRRPMFYEFASLSSVALVDVVAASDPAASYAALSILRGVIPRGLPKRAPDSEALATVTEIIHEQLPPDLARAAVATLMNPLDEMSVAAFPAFRLGRDLGVDEINCAPMARLGDIGPYPSEAFDMHERRGRRAIALLAVELSDSLLWLRDLPKRALNQAVGDAVFVVEGSTLDRWAAGSALCGLRAEADQLSLTRHGLDELQAFALADAVRAALPRLHELRLRIVDVQET